MGTWAQMHAPVMLTVLLIGVCGLIAAWDVYAVYGPGPRYTVSAQIRDWASEWPVLPFLLGLLAGHLFWGSAHTPPHGG